MITSTLGGPCVSDLSLQSVITSVCDILDEEKSRIPKNEQMKDFLDKLATYGQKCSTISNKQSLSLQEIKNAIADDACPEWYRKRLSSRAVLLKIVRLYGDSNFRVKLEDLRLVIVTMHNGLIERWKLIAYAKDNCSIIRSVDLAQYIAQWVSEMTEFSKDELQYACCLYEHKFSFFIDPMMLKSYPIRDIISSGFLQEMTNALSDNDIDNWFSRKNFDYVLSTYKQLDEDCNGLISATELMNFADFNPEFIGRLFAQKNVYDEHGEMDFGGFCDFMLAINHADDLSAWKYFFSILDSDGDGFISICDVRSLACSLVDKLQATNRGDLFQMPNIDDLLTYEFWDIIGCTDKEKLSFHDITNSAMGTTFFRVVSDVEQFMRYDDRETQPQDDPAGPIEDRVYP